MQGLRPPCLYFCCEDIFSLIQKSFLGAYEQIRQSGFLELPHRTTLNTYTGFTDICTGFNPDVIKFMIQDCFTDSPKNHECEIALLFDEMQIKAGLVFNRHSGKLVGFTEIGSINEELEEFERKVKGKTTKQLATHVFCIMARGLLMHMNYPIGYYYCHGFTSNQIFPVIWEGVRIMEMSGFCVRAFVSDGAAPNRRFYQLHRLQDDVNVSADGVVFWAWNRYAKHRKIYFICDPLHLIKTLRNNLENSNGHNKTRHLMVRNVFDLLASFE